MLWLYLHHQFSVCKLKKNDIVELCAGNTKLGFKSADVLVEGQVSWWSLYVHYTKYDI